MKKSEIKNLSKEELIEKLVKARKEYTDMKMSHSVAPIENPLQLRTKRREVARLLAEITKRELQ